MLINLFRSVGVVVRGVVREKAGDSWGGGNKPPGC